MNYLISAIFCFITFLSQENHWDLFSGTGCQSCACDSQGSTGAGCDLYTGQCECRAGVSGRSCDQCTPGFYDFTDLGCRGKITKLQEDNCFVFKFACTAACL